MMAPSFRYGLAVIGLTFSAMFCTVAAAQTFGASDSPWAPIKRMLDGKKNEIKKPSRPAALEKVEPLNDSEEEDQENNQEIPENSWVERRSFWMPLAQFQDASALYLPNDFVVQGGFIFTSVLFNYLSPHVSPGGKMHKSAISRVRIPCVKKDSVVTVGSTFFSMNEGEGFVVDEITQPSLLSETNFSHELSFKLIEKFSYHCT